MASTKGVSLKAIKTFEGCEGTGFSANMYVDGKKIGSVTDSAYGGQMDFFFDSKEGEKLFETRVKAYVDDYPEEDWMYLRTLNAGQYRKEKDAGALPMKKIDFEVEGTFISRLFQLSMYEKSYKKAKKQGYNSIAVFTYPMIKGPIGATKVCYIKNITKEGCLLMAKGILNDLRREKGVAYDLEHLFFEPNDFDLL